MHRLAQDMMRVHFGLGTATAVDAIEVRWPNGDVQRWTGLPVDRVAILTEGSSSFTLR
jgi:hypothetical protein